MGISLILDFVLVIFLAITICYAIVLNKRLGSLRRDRDVLEKMALNFHASTERAEQSILKLKASGEVLKGTINKAETLKDDLVFLSARGGASADRLENAIRMARNEIDRSRINQSDPDVPRATAPKIKIKEGEPGAIISEDETLVQDGSKSNEEISEEEKELLRALRSAG